MPEEWLNGWTGVPRNSLMKTLSALATMFALLSQSGEASAQSAPPQNLPETTELGEVVVNASPLDRRAEAFVRSVGAPVEGRKLATWADHICVGAAGLAVEPARALVDRVLDWAASLGLRAAGPGCHPNILVVFTDDGDRTARELVEARPLDFEPGVGTSNRGRAALRAFQASGRPVRWWHVSLPLDPDTGAPVVRLRGEPPFVAPRLITRPSDLGNYGQITMGSRLYDDSVDALQSAIIVVDIAALDQASFAQLSDYVAMVALAQINPETGPEIPSILTLFEPDIAQADTLTRWDQAFLQTLYGTHQRNVPAQSDRTLIARGVARRLREEGVSEHDPAP